jgi:hypothetical protein
MAESHDPQGEGNGESKARAPLQELKPKNKKQAGYLTSGRGSVTARACAAKTGYATGGAGEIVERISRRPAGADRTGD